jgi:hypothetical protein
MRMAADVNVHVHFYMAFTIVGIVARPWTG